MNELFNSSEGLITIRPKDILDEDKTKLVDKYYKKINLLMIHDRSYFLNKEVLETKKEIIKKDLRRLFPFDKYAYDMIDVLNRKDRDRGFTYIYDDELIDLLADMKANYKKILTKTVERWVSMKNFPEFKHKPGDMIEWDGKKIFIKSVNSKLGLFVYDDEEVMFEDFF